MRKMPWKLIEVLIDAVNQHDLRVGQLFCNLQFAATRDLFYVDNDELAAMIEKHLTTVEQIADAMDVPEEAVNETRTVSGQRYAQQPSAIAPPLVINGVAHDEAAQIKAVAAVTGRTPCATPNVANVSKAKPKPCSFCGLPVKDGKHIPAKPKTDPFLIRWADLGKAAYDNGKAHGFDPDQHEAIWVALAHSEVSEVLEAYRHHNPISDTILEFSSVEEELADLVIRVLEHSHAKGYDVAGAVLAKMSYNMDRPMKHGGKPY